MNRLTLESVLLHQMSNREHYLRHVAICERCNTVLDGITTQRVVCGRCHQNDVTNVE